MFAALGTRVETLSAMDVSRPKVTVLMSVWNGERFLQESIDSILNQSFRDFEFIIINDASTDGTEKILLSYDDRRIQVINNEANMGLTRSLNKGLTLAQGEYVARMDADDISMPERLARQVAFLDEDPEVVLVTSYLLKIDLNGSTISEIAPPVNHDEIIAQLIYHDILCHSVLMYRKQAVLKIGAYKGEVSYAQDYDLLLRLANTGKFGVVPSLLHKFRVNPETGISRLKDREQKECVLKFSDEFLRLCCPTFLEDQSESFNRFQCARLTKDWSILHQGDISRIRPFLSFISRTSFGREYWRKHLFSWAVHLIRYNKEDSVDLFLMLLTRFRGIREPKQTARYAYYFAKEALCKLVR